LRLIGQSDSVLFMLRIRLQRVGRKNQPYFRFVLTDSKNSTKSGKFLEVLGHFDYRKNGQHAINAERVKHLISKGAKPTDSVHNYLVDQKILSGKKINVLPRKNPVKKDAGESSIEKKDVPKEAPTDPHETP